MVVIGVDRTAVSEVSNMSAASQTERAVLVRIFSCHVLLAYLFASSALSSLWLHWWITERWLDTEADGINHNGSPVSNNMHLLLFVCFVLVVSQYAHLIVNLHFTSPHPNVLFWLSFQLMCSHLIESHVHAFLMITKHYVCDINAKHNVLSHTGGRV